MISPRHILAASAVAAALIVPATASAAPAAPDQAPATADRQPPITINLDRQKSGELLTALVNEGEAGVARFLCKEYSWAQGSDRCRGAARQIVADIPVAAARDALLKRRCVRLTYVRAGHWERPGRVMVTARIVTCK